MTTHPPVVDGMPRLSEESGGDHASVTRLGVHVFGPLGKATSDDRVGGARTWPLDAGPLVAVGYPRRKATTSRLRGCQAEATRSTATKGVPQCRKANGVDILIGN